MFLTFATRQIECISQAEAIGSGQNGLFTHEFHIWICDSDYLDSKLSQPTLQSHIPWPRQLPAQCGQWLRAAATGSMERPDLLHHELEHRS